MAIMHSAQSVALLHAAIFYATCLATALRNKLHEKLQRVT